ncbi:VanZ family protein [Lentibacillus juripiscarius]|uniref:VanZ family protein n=1 Tax=Lentibacillus juripiscarius TaxID=257446 RepID=A0ABW5V5C2_9BACI
MKKWVYWLLPVMWMGVIFYSSATPYEQQDVKPFMGRTFDLSFMAPYVDWIAFTYHHAEVSVAALGVEGFIEFFLRKGAHVGVFFILMCLFFIAIRQTTRLRLRAALAVSFFLTAAYAGMDEFHQSFTANRTPYAGDVLLDTAGALLAGILLVFFQRKRDKK